MIYKHILGGQHKNSSNATSLSITLLRPKFSLILHLLVLLFLQLLILLTLLLTMILHGYWYGVRVCTQHPISKFVSNDSSSPPHCAFVSALTSLFVPQGLQEPLERPKWKETIVEEMGTLSKNDTWQLVSLPTGVIVIQGIQLILRGIRELWID